MRKANPNPWKPWLICVGVFAAGWSPAGARAQPRPPENVVHPSVHLTLGEPPSNQRLVEHERIEVPFTFEVGPGPGGARPLLDLVVCGGEGRPGEPCVAFAGGTPDKHLRGVLNLSIPPAGPSEIFSAVVCTKVADANQVLSCGHTLARKEFRRPVFARFVLGLDHFIIRHTRARHADTVYLGYAGLFGSGRVDQAAVDQLNACTGGIQVASARRLITCRAMARYGVEDLGDGIYPARKDLAIGVFEIVPRSGGRLNFGYVLFNFGFPGEPPGVEEAMRGNSMHAIVPELVTQDGSGLHVMNPTPLRDLTHQLNGSPWLGCDGPTAGSAETLPNDGSDRSLDALTRSTGRYASFLEQAVTSQAGCGGDSRYEVTWFVERTSWRP